MLRNEVNFKALTFISEQTASTFNYEVKGVRALWDPSLSIPGTDRRGGWRCPVGTRYGGQITDRFGRSCGWGVARRIANQIADIGERLESIDDRKRNSRLAKRNARVARQLQRGAKPGRVERGLRGAAEALEGGEVTPSPRAISAPSPQVIDASPRRRRGNLRESEQRRMEREIEQPGAPRTAEPVPKNPPRARRRNAAQQGAKRSVRRKPEADFVDGSKPVPAAKPARTVTPRPLVIEADPDFGKPTAKPKPAARVEPPAAPPKPETPIPDPPTWNPTADELGGSIPDDRSIRNVRNRFRERGLPDTAYWREKDFPEGEERAELERRFGRYYGKNKKRNARGNYVNQKITAGANPPALPRSQPPQPPARVEPPAAPPQPFDIQQIFANGNEQEKRQLLAALGEIDNKKFNAKNNMRAWNDQNKDELARNIEIAKAEQLVADQRLEQAKKDFEGQKDNSRLREMAASGLISAHRSREVNKNNLDVMEQRLKDINEGKPWQAPAIENRPPVPINRPRPQNEEVPEPEGGFDVSPPSAKRDHKPELVVAKGEDGLPEVKAVPKGNKGLDTQEIAAKHLEDGGDLADVPDDYLGFAIKNSPKRFEEKVGAGGGVNANINGNMSLYVDKTNGKKYFLKYQVRSVAPNEDLHELVGNNLAGRLGMPIGGVRLDGKQTGAENGRAMLFEHAGNYVEGALTPGRDADLSQIKPSDRVRATVLDFVMVNMDRHGGNFFVSTDENGKRRFVPIDPSLGFDAEWNGRPHQNVDGDDDGLTRFLSSAAGGQRNQMINTLRSQYRNGEISRREVTAALRDVQKSIREAEAKNPYMNMVDEALKTAGGGGTALKRSVDNEEDRIKIKPMRRLKYVTDKDPAVLADILLGITR